MEGRVYFVGIGTGACGQLGPDVGEFVGGNDGDYTGELASTGGVDAEDGGVGVGAAEEGCVEEAWNLDVVEVKAIPKEEPVVLKAPKRLADIARRGTPPKTLVKIITRAISRASTHFGKLLENWAGI